MDEIEQWRADRNKALIMLDMEWARKRLPDATSANVLLMAMHKARYECTDLDMETRLISSEWLKTNKCDRMDGTPVLNAGILPD